MFSPTEGVMANTRKGTGSAERAIADAALDALVGDAKVPAEFSARATAAETAGRTHPRRGADGAPRLCTGHGEARRAGQSS